LYNADFIANNTQIVIVNIQYRLGALGFFYNGGSSGGTVPGNLGIYDQTFALQWIQDNIQSFGGDPNQVTLWGQSAGGTSIAIHMISPASYSLINGGCMDSNPITLYLNTKKEASEISSRFADLIGCNITDMACLQAQSIDDILVAQNASVKIYILEPLNAFMPWQPFVDGVLIPDQPLNAFATGNYNTEVPFLCGTVAEEALMFIYQAFPKPVTYAEYIAILGIIFGPVAEQVLAQYPVSPSQYSDTRPVMSVLGTDYIWVCSYRSTIRNMTSHGTDVYYYLFNHTFTNFDPWGPNYPECVNEVCHGSELPYVFNSAEIGDFYTHYVWSPSEATLAALASTFWGNFANSGTPTGPFPTSVQWPVYQTQLDQNIQLATPSFIESGYLDSTCDFWDTLGYHWGNVPLTAIVHGIPQN